MKVKGSKRKLKETYETKKVSINKISKYDKKITIKFSIIFKKRVENKNVTKKTQKNCCKK